jgi:hypothetical protein
MLIFAVGLPVPMAGGRAAVDKGNFYVGAYTVSALALLMLSSLGGLRAYFISRKVRFPAGIGWFWIGLGTVMIAMVSLGALQLPKPAFPGMAYIESHETDFWTKDSTFELLQPEPYAADIDKQMSIVDALGQGVLVLFGLFMAYAFLRAMGKVAANIAQRRDRLPEFIVRFFDRIDRLLLRILKMPRLPSFRRRIRVSRHIATSANYHSPLDGRNSGSREEIVDCVAKSYEALCALAVDLGVPREIDQTPYEFVEQFPRPLRGLKKEALELTQIYVQSAYSSEPLDDRVMDRLRKFWVVYEQVRRRVLK